MILSYIALAVGAVVVVAILAFCFIAAFREAVKQKWKSKQSKAFARYNRLMRIPNDTDIEDWGQKVWNRYTGEDNSSCSLPACLETMLTSDQLVTAKKDFEAAETERKERRQKSKTDVAEKDRAVVYLERIVDRMINKGRGILPFNSILITLLGIQVSVFHIQDYFGGFGSWVFNTVAAIALIMLVSSSILLLMLFAVYWAEPSTFETLKKEFDHTVTILRKRVAVLQTTIALSMCGLVCILILAAMASWVGGGISETIRGIIIKERQVQQIEQDKSQQSDPKGAENANKGQQEKPLNPAPPKVVVPTPNTGPK